MVDGGQRTTDCGWLYGELINQLDLSFLSWQISGSMLYEHCPQ